VERQREVAAVPIFAAKERRDGRSPEPRLWSPEAPAASGMADLLYLHSWHLQFNFCE